MSSSVQGGPAVAGQQEKKLGVGKKLLSRVKTALLLKRSSYSSKRQSTISAAAVETGPSSTPAGSSTAAPMTSQPISAPAEPPKKPQQQQPPPSPQFKGTKIPRSQIHEERARRLAERYGLELGPTAWHHPLEGHVLRVEKPIRMRVHRKCHQCDVFFGAAKECPKCGHNFCKECERYPQKRTEAEKIASRERRAAMLMEHEKNPIIMPDWNLNPREKIVLRRPGKPGGQELVYKKISQRVRRTCCKCLETDATTMLFTGGKRECPRCDHARCTDCPRDPPSRNKYPYGYPGDEFGDKSTPHYRCHECRAKFPPGAQDGTECHKCQHQKCASCRRIRPQKVEPEPDPEIMRSVMEKMAALDFS